MAQSLDFFQTLLSWFSSPLSMDFFQRALIAGLLASVAGGLLSGFIVWRGMAFIGDALSHVILPGIVVAHILGQNLLLGALVASLLAVLGMGLLAKQRGLKEDTAIGIIFVGFFALGVVLLRLTRSFQDLTHVLFGQIYGVSWADVLIIGLLVLLIAAGVLLFFKELLVTSFDPTHSVAIGLSPTLIHFGLLIAIALTTVVTIQTVGVLMVLAYLITPGAIAGFFTKKLSLIIPIGVAFSAGSTLIGFFLSFWLDLQTGPTIVLVLFLIFMVFFLSHQIKLKFSVPKTKED